MKVLDFIYDEAGRPFALNYSTNGGGSFNTYYYILNLQGDVIELVEYIPGFSYSVKATYTYDAWGNILTSTGTLASINPLRYRGYYYDTETGFYYVSSRYYDPETCRFINADTTGLITATPNALTDKNLYAYCDNNPIMRIDHGGQFWDTIFDGVSLVVSIVDVVKHPDDPMAWVGLAADVVSLAVPFATGGGAIVKAVSKADDVADVVKTANKVDNVVDTTKAVKKGWSVGDDVSTLTKAGNSPSWSTVRQRYWKNAAASDVGAFSSNSLSRMKKGLAPIGKDGFSMELHHPLGRSGANFFDFEPLTQTSHRAIHNR